MLCLKKRRTYSFTQGACKDLPRRSTKEKNGYNEALNIAVTTLPRKHRSREERSSAGGMVLTVTEDTPADMLAGSMELLVQLPRDHHVHTQRVTVPRSTPMMDLLVQIATAHKLSASSYTLQAIGERGLVLPHQPNTPIGALDALQVKLLPKQGTFLPRKAKQANQPFETTFRLQVLLPRNQLYVSRVSPKMNLGKILEEVCREKNLDKNKYELRHPANLEETLDLSLSLQDYHLQEVTLYAKQGRTLGAALSSQDIMALQRQEERRRQQAKQSVFGFMFRKSKESSLSTDSLGGRSVSPARSDETGRSVSPLAPPARPQRKRRPAPKPPVQTSVSVGDEHGDESKEKLVISHSRNSSDSSGYHEASVLSDNPDSNARMPETLPRRSKPPCKLETARKLAQTSQASKSLGNLAMASGGLSHGISSTSISSTGIRKKRAAPPPPIARPLSSAISTQALERIVDSEESLTSDIDISKSPSDIAASSKANSDIGVDSKANSDIGVHSLGSKPSSEIGYKIDSEFRAALAGHEDQIVDFERRTAPAPPLARLKPSLDLQTDIPMPETMKSSSVEEPKKVEPARVVKRETEVRAPIPKPRCVGNSLHLCEPQIPVAPRRKIFERSVSAAPDFSLLKLNGVESYFTETSTDGDIEINTEIDGTKDFVNDDVKLFAKLGEKNDSSNELPNASESYLTESLTNKKKRIDAEIDIMKDLKKNDSKFFLDLQENKDSSSEYPVESYLTETSTDGDHIINAEIKTTKNLEKNYSELFIDLQENKDSSRKYPVESYLTETSTDGDHIINAEIKTTKNLEKNYSELFVDPQENKDSNTEHLKNSDKNSRAEKKHTIALSNRKSVEGRTLKHVKSLDDIYGSSIEFDDEEISKENKSLSKGLSCAVISTIPKCAHLTNLNDANGIDIDKSIIKTEKNKISDKAETSSNESDQLEFLKDTIKTPKRTKVFRSQSATTDFDVNSFEKHTRYLTSHPESFSCALNPNFSRNVVNPETVTSNKNEAAIEVNPESKSSNKKQKVMKKIDSDWKKNFKNGVENFPPFVIHGTNWKSGEQFEDAENDDSWAPQMIDQSVSGDRTTETDILLQKVSDTLSNSLPSSHSPPLPPLEVKISSEVEDIAIVSRVEFNKKQFDESDGFQINRASVDPSATNITEKAKPREIVEIKKRESLLSENNVVNASSPNATMNSQQDTSDYVSATGDDLSITDWEYQLPAPPSAFRDNISPDFDGYDTITLRSVEAFKEPIANASEYRQPLEAPIIDSPLRESPIPPPTKEIKQISKPIVASKLETNQIKSEVQNSLPEKSKLSQQTSNESRTSESSSELKKEIINELANKIENGSLSQSNSRITDQEFRRTTDECAAPKIAPADNTLSNFTITTYSRQKSLNIFEEAAEERRNVPLVKNTEEKVIRTFATLSRNKPSSQINGGNFGSKNVLDRAEDDFSSEGKLGMTRAQSVEHIITPEVEFKIPELKTHFNQHDSLFRRQSMSNGHEKSNIVHRSKSYITLANNSKYRENADGENRNAYARNDHDDGLIVKSTSVTNLNQEAHRNNEKFSQWRDNILKKQEEPSKEKQLQSLQVLKSILPQLKSTQQTEENDLDSSNKNEHSHDVQSKTLPEAEPTNEPKSNATTEAETKPQKTAEDATTKRYKYTGPPAISLGSWSERPRVNVQLKMDTDYKFGVNNTSGSKTIVNLNRTNGDKNADVHSKENLIKPLPKNSSITNCITTNQETSSRLERRDSENLPAKNLINQTPSTTGFKKPLLNKVGFPESKNISRTEDKPMVTSVALKKTHIEKIDNRINGQNRPDVSDDDDVKIDTKPVNFKELTKTFGQEVCLRPKPKRVIQNRHSDYYGNRPDIVKNFGNTINGQTSFIDNANKNPSRNSDFTTNHVVSNGMQKDPNHAPIKRYTSVVGIQSHNNNNYATENGDSAMKNHNTITKINNLMPVVKGFKIQTNQNESKISNVPISHNDVAVVDVSKKNTSFPPPPPTMPIITGVTLKNSTARPKSMPVNSLDTRDQLLESIRNFGGRDKLKSVLS